MLARGCSCAVFWVWGGYEMHVSTKLLRLLTVLLKDAVGLACAGLAGLVDLSSRTQIAGRIDRTGEPDWG
jgi:hypothetical protein